MNDTERQLRPCLAELLRTCIKPSSLVLQVHQLVTQETTTDSASDPSAPRPSEAVTRFYLTDGELLIQAILQSSFLADHDPSVGDIIQVQDFVLRKARRLNGNGKIVYLSIQNFKILRQQKSKTWEGEGGFVKSDEEEVQSDPPPKRRRVAFTALRELAGGTRVSIQHPGAMSKVSLKRSQEENNVRDEDTESEDGFESLDVDLRTVQERRQMLHNLQHDAVVSRTESKENDTSDSSYPSLQPTADTNSHLFHPQSSLQPLYKTPSLTPPYHPLSALLSPSLPSKNYPLSTLAIITYVSSTLLSKPNSPFPPKRNIRLLDPSLPDTHPQGFTLAVYIDAKSFLPPPGTIALFRGIVMQKFGKEVILNAYASLKREPVNEEWYIDDVETLEGLGFDVKRMRAWWEDRVSRNAKK